MQKPQWTTDTIKAGHDFHIRHQPIIQHNLINALAITMLWSTIVATLALGTIVHWGWYPLLGILLGSAFFGHFVLIIHEASHNMLFLTKDLSRRKTLNHSIGHLASIPFFTDYNRHWKEGHVTHHLRPCEEDDPQNPDPLYGDRLLRKIAQVWFLPFGFLLANPSAKYDDKLKRMGLGLSCLLPVVGILYILHPPSLLVLYIGFTTLATLNLCKIAQEHGAGLQHEPFAILRSRTYFYPLQWLFSPFNIHYHYEHHANFNVPWYLLPAYHQTVRELIPVNIRHHFIHREYWAQLMGRKGLPNWDTVIDNEH